MRAADPQLVIDKAGSRDASFDTIHQRSANETRGCTSGPLFFVLDRSLPNISHWIRCVSGVCIPSKGIRNRGEGWKRKERRPDNLRVKVSPQVGRARMTGLPYRVRLLLGYLANRRRRRARRLYGGKTWSSIGNLGQTDPLKVLSFVSPAGQHVERILYTECPLQWNWIWPILSSALRIEMLTAAPFMVVEIICVVVHFRVGARDDGLQDS